MGKEMREWGRGEEGERCPKLFSLEWICQWRREGGDAGLGRPGTSLFPVTLKNASDY